MHCLNCGAEVSEQKKFCGQYGTAIARRCPICGATNPPSNKFCEECGTALGAAPAIAASDRYQNFRLVERRQLTVLFCDLVGSTALSARLDPEDLSAIIAAYRRCITETIALFNGFVAQHYGDGAVVYFGYPQAHEDDAERAMPLHRLNVAAVSGARRRRRAESSRFYSWASQDGAAVYRKDRLQ